VNVLVINCGSSSLKYELFDMAEEAVLARGLIERIADPAGEPALVHHRTRRGARVDYEAEIADHTAAVAEMARLLTSGEGKVIDSLHEVDAVGHRVVHGGEEFSQSVVIDAKVIEAIERCAALAPLHNPPNLAGIRAAQQALPEKPHVAVFDTAFHQTMPRMAYLYALPRSLYEEHGVRRYGFHGTSHYYVSQRAAEMLSEMGRDGARARIITCHLGNGCSMSAVVGGECVDTSMGLTPLEGLVMGTRSGDIDPAIVWFAAQKLGLDFSGIDQLLNKRSGLLGLSGISNDMREICQAAEQGHEAARDALEVFCYRVRKYIGAYAAAMGGVDAIAFTAGIGENSALVREKVLAPLAFLGVKLDEAANREGEGDRCISTPDAPCAVFVIKTQEELVIARETVRACSAAGAS